MIAETLSYEDNIITTLDPRAMSSTGTVTLEYEGPVSLSEGVSVVSETMHSFAERQIISARDVIRFRAIQIRHGILEARNILGWYGDLRTQFSSLPYLGWKAGFPCAFPVVEATVLGGVTHYFLDPAAEWSDEILDQCGWKARRVILRPTDQDEVLIFSDDFPVRAQVSVSLADCAETSGCATQPEETRENWRAGLEDRLTELKALPDDWNSYGARKIDERVLAYARTLLTELYSSQIPPPQVVPTAGGGVQFEWHTKQKDLEIYLKEPERASFLYEDHEGAIERSGDIPADIEELRGILRELAA